MVERGTGTMQHIEFADVGNISEQGSQVQASEGSSSSCSIDGEAFRTKSDFTIAMDEVDRQCNAIQQILDREEMGLQNAVAEMRRYIREREKQAQGERDIERNAGVARREHCSGCEKLVEYSKVASIKYVVFILCFVVIIASPVLFT